MSWQPVDGGDIIRDGDDDCDDDGGGGDDGGDDDCDGERFELALISSSQLGGYISIG